MFTIAFSELDWSNESTNRELTINSFLIIIMDIRNITWWYNLTIVNKLVAYGSILHDWHVQKHHSIYLWNQFSLNFTNSNSNRFLSPIYFVQLMEITPGGFRIFCWKSMDSNGWCNFFLNFSTWGSIFSEILSRVLPLLSDSVIKFEIEKQWDNSRDIVPSVLAGVAENQKKVASGRDSTQIFRILF